MRYLLLYFKGMLMGAADLVPGVSGGTVALITGIYKELLDSINAVSWSTLKLLKKVGIVAIWKKIKGPFLLAISTKIGNVLLHPLQPFFWKRFSFGTFPTQSGFSIP